MSNQFSYDAYKKMQAEDALRKRYQGAYKWLGSSWNDEALQRKTLENFDVSRQQQAVNDLRTFLSDPTGTLILHGQFGAGKTHLLAALCNELIKAEKQVRFTTSPNLFAAIQDRVTNHQSYIDLVTLAATADLLILDDVDKAKHSDFREETYFSIIDARIKRDLPIALSTNRLSELATFMGGAVASRLQIGQLAVEMNGQDYRSQL